MSAACATCQFREPDKRPEYATSGQCRRFPPTVSKIINVFGNVEWDNLLPWVGPDDWCGEYRALISKEPT